MKGQAPFLTKSKEGLLMRLHVQPKASRNAIVGLHGDRLKVAVQAPPTDGKANKMVQQLLAKTLNIPKSRVQLKSGASSREKTFLIDGMPKGEILSKLGF